MIVPLVVVGGRGRRVGPNMCPCHNVVLSRSVWFIFMTMTGSRTGCNEGEIYKRENLWV